MWRFVQISDPHLASQRDGIWNNRFLCTMMPELMKCLGRDLADLQPEFLLVTGDIASTQTREAMFEARDMMESLAIPYYPMGGNHDFVLGESRAWFLEAFKDRLPEPRTYYSFTHRNLHFCVLDAWWLWTDGTLCEVSEACVASALDFSLKDARWAIPPQQFHWLAADLEAHPNVPTIVAVHFPALPIPKRLHRPDFNDGGFLDNGDLLLECLQNYPQVKAIFSGHVHLNFVARQNGITQIVTGALPEFPTEYRDVQVYPDRLEIRTLGLSNPDFARQSLIPGRDWTAGALEDRQLVVPL